MTRNRFEMTQFSDLKWRRFHELIHTIRFHFFVKLTMCCDNQYLSSSPVFSFAILKQVSNNIKTPLSLLFLSNKAEYYLEKLLHASDTICIVQIYSK